MEILLILSTKILMFFLFSPKQRIVTESLATSIGDSVVTRSSCHLDELDKQFKAVVYGKHSSIATAVDIAVDIAVVTKITLKPKGKSTIQHGNEPATFLTSNDWQKLRFDGSVMYAVEIDFDGSDSIVIDDIAENALSRILEDFPLLSFKSATVEGIKNFFMNSSYVSHA